MENPLTVLSQVASVLEQLRITYVLVVFGIIGASSARLDLDYFCRWAETLGTTDLLDQAFAEAKGKDPGSSFQ
jgi:hypothetical protein